jgi:hypothetical protein
MEEPEQLELFPKAVGTGLSNDPSNKEYRSEVVRSLFKRPPGVRPSQQESALNNEPVPLQHLVDLKKAGVTYKLSSDLPKGVVGRYHHVPYPEVEFNANATHATNPYAWNSVVTHETGHAINYVLSDQFKTPFSDDPAYAEGMADAYSVKYTRPTAYDAPRARPNASYARFPKHLFNEGMESKRKEVEPLPNDVSITESAMRDIPARVYLSTLNSSNADPLWTYGISNAPAVAYHDDMGNRLYGKDARNAHYAAMKEQSVLNGEQLKLF